MDRIHKEGINSTLPLARKGCSEVLQRGDMFQSLRGSDLNVWDQFQGSRDLFQASRCMKNEWDRFQATIDRSLALKFLTQSPLKLNNVGVICPSFSHPSNPTCTNEIKKIIYPPNHCKHSPIYHLKRTSFFPADPSFHLR